MTKRLTGAILLVAMASPAFAQAQLAPPQGNVEERSRQQIRILDDRAHEDALMSGDTDIILLRKARLFNLHGSADMGATDNAYLSPAKRQDDGFVQVQAGIGFATRIADRIDIVADASLVTVRYFGETALDYSAFSGLVGVASRLGPVKLAAVYHPSVVFTRDFGTRQLTSHRFRLSASLDRRVHGVAVQPEVHGERAVTRPSAYSAWSGGGSVTVSTPVSKTVPLLAYAQIGYDRRSFDDYFEAFVGVKRKDHGLTAGAGIIWRPLNFGELRASYSFGRNWSTSDVNRYRVHSGTLGLSATFHF